MPTPTTVTTFHLILSGRLLVACTSDLGTIDPAVVDIERIFQAANRIGSVTEDCFAFRRQSPFNEVLRGIRTMLDVKQYRSMSVGDTVTVARADRIIEYMCGREGWIIDDSEAGDVARP